MEWGTEKCMACMARPKIYIICQIQTNKESIMWNSNIILLIIHTCISLQCNILYYLKMSCHIHHITDMITICVNVYIHYDPDVWLADWRNISKLNQQDLGIKGDNLSHDWHGGLSAARSHIILTPHLSYSLQLSVELDSLFI